MSGRVSIVRSSIVFVIGGSGQNNIVIVIGGSGRKFGGSCLVGEYFLVISRSVQKFGGSARVGS